MLEITVRVAADTLEEAIKLLAAAVPAQKIKITGMTESEDAVKAVKTEETDMAAVPAKKEKKSQKKTEATEEKPPWEEDKKESGDSTEPTILDARKALAGLAGSGKKSEAKQILKDLGCEQLSDVKAADYAGIIKKCQEVA